MVQCRHGLLLASLQQRVRRCLYCRIDRTCIPNACNVLHLIIRQTRVSRVQAQHSIVRLPHRKRSIHADSIVTESEGFSFNFFYGAVLYWCLRCHNMVVRILKK